MSFENFNEVVEQFGITVYCGDEHYPPETAQVWSISDGESQAVCDVVFNPGKYRGRFWFHATQQVQRASTATEILVHASRLYRKGKVKND